MSERFLTRKRLRDAVILLAAGSAFFFPVASAHIVLAALFLVPGTFLHFVTKGTLIRNEVLCTGGIYAVVRHPYYLANYLVDTGLCLLSGNVYLLLAYPLLFFWSYGPTFREEEAVLRRKHGDASFEYILSTPSVFPDRLSISHVSRLLDGFSFRRISRKEVARIIRFYGVAVMLLLLHEIAVHPFDISLSAVYTDIPILALLACTAVLFGSSRLILKAVGRPAS